MKVSSLSRHLKGLVYISSLLWICGLFLINAHAQDATQFSLPEGAKARLGKGFIHDIAYSPNGTLIAVATSIGVWLYDAKTGAEVTLFSGHANAVLSVAFSPDSTTVAGGGGLGEDYSIRLWDISTEKQTAVLSEHTSDDVRSIAFSPDGTMLVSGDDDSKIRLWDLDTGKLKRVISGHTNNVYSVTFSPDSKTIASGSWDYTVRLWDSDTGQLKKILSGHTKEIFSVAFSPDGQLLASGSWDNTIRLWNANTGENIKTINEHKGKVKSVAFSPEGHTSQAEVKDI